MKHAAVMDYLGKEEPQIGLSIKSLDKYRDLDRLVYDIEKTDISFIHLDFFDGEMVKDYGVKPEEVSRLRRLTDLTIEAHLMEYYPNDMEFYMGLGIDRVLIHHESYCDKEKVLLKAKEIGMGAGIALKPSSPHNDINIIHPEISDVILVMATKSGSGGNSYDEETPYRIRQIASNYHGPIEVNSGVITYPNKPITEGSTYHLSKAGATRFSLENGLLDIGLSIKEAVALNIRAAAGKD